MSTTMTFWFQKCREFPLQVNNYQFLEKYTRHTNELVNCNIQFHYHNTEVVSVLKFCVISPYIIEESAAFIDVILQI
jgi:hypothetical protein